MTESKDIDLLLIGKTGNGKSATGNSILRRRAFESIFSMTSVTSMVQYEVSEFNGRVIKVVDGPGVGDTRLTIEDGVNLILGTMEYAIAANPRGYHAFLLVLKYGVRFTKEEQEAIVFLKKVFGESFVRTYCILVVTYGDHFDRDSRISFQEWCRNEHGSFKELINECNNRVVLFDNMTKDEHKKCDQISRLLEMVDNLSSHSNRYTDENFRAAKEKRELIILEAKEPIIREETLKETSLILQKLQELELTQDFELRIKQSEELQNRAGILFQKISSQDLRTGLLHDLCEAVKSMQRTIEEEIKFCCIMKDEKERIVKKEEEKLRKLEDQLRRERQENEKRLQDHQRFLEQNKILESEQEKKKREIEEKIKLKREKSIRKYHKKIQDENEKFKKDVEDFEKQYRHVKTENDRSFLQKLVSVVTWPFRKIGELFSKSKQ